MQVQTEQMFTFLKLKLSFEVQMSFLVKKKYLHRSNAELQNKIRATSEKHYN